MISLLVQTGPHQQPLRKGPPIESLARNIITCIIPPLGGSATYHHHSALESNDECGAVHYHRLTCVAATIIDSNIIETHYCSESVYAYDLPSPLLSLTAKKGGAFCSVLKHPIQKKWWRICRSGLTSIWPFVTEYLSSNAIASEFLNSTLLLPPVGCKRDTHTVLVPCIIYIFHLLPCMLL